MPCCAAAQEREEELGHMLEGAQASLAAMQRLYTAAQNQLFELQSASEEAAVGKQFEWEAAAAELERAQEQLAALEAEKSALQDRLSSHAEASTTAAGGVPASGSSSVVEDTLRQEVASLRDVNARLRQDIAAAHRGLADAEAAWGEQVEGLQEALTAAERQQQELQAELQHRPTQSQVGAAAGLRGSSSSSRRRKGSRGYRAAVARCTAGTDSSRHSSRVQVVLNCMPARCQHASIAPQSILWCVPGHC
jgi:chromosome segregation ATPase